MTKKELEYFISRCWEDCNRLSAIKDSEEADSAVAGTIQDLTDAYLICLGKLEAKARTLKDTDDSFVVLNKDSNGYIETGDNKIVGFKDELTAKTVANAVGGTMAEVPNGNSVHTAEDETKPVQIVNDWSTFDMDFDEPVGDKITDFDLYGIQPKAKEVSADAPELKNVSKAKIASQEVVSEDDMWNCDFDEPVGEKLTDKDLYPEDE